MRGMRSNRAVNQPTGGGPKKSGLAASNLGSAGVGLLHGRTYMGGPRGVQANYRNKDLVFYYKSYIGGIGHSVGGRSLHGMMDGVRSISTSPEHHSAKPKLALNKCSPADLDKVSVVQPDPRLDCHNYSRGPNLPIQDCNFLELYDQKKTPSVIICGNDDGGSATCINKCFYN